MANLITAFEVITYSPAGKDYPQKFVCEAINREEEAFGHECLGAELYEFLLEKLTPYNANTTTEWKPGQTYALNIVVIRNGCLFKSTKNGNQTDPANDIAGDWVAIEKFTDACANELWVGYLRQTLAFRVYMSTLNFSTHQAGAGGVTIQVPDASGRRSASKGEISDLKTTLQHQIEMNTANMMRWLRKKQDDDLCTLPINSVWSCKSGSCPTPGRKGRRWGFRK